MNNSKRAIVVGGGIAGMSSALLLAKRGHAVTLVEPKPAVGGLFPLLDRQFPTQTCGVCFMACEDPTYCPFLQCELAPEIDLLTASEVTGVEKTGEGFTVTITRKPTGVIRDKCVDCGECEVVCPVSIPDPFASGIEERKAVNRCFPKPVPMGFSIDFEACTRCGKCVKVCPTDAIDLDQTEKTVEVSAAAAVLAMGGELIEPPEHNALGFNRYPEVLTGAQFERLLASGGPTNGKIIRHTDDKPIKKLGFTQCVGSRDPASGCAHCSSVCCMFALKQALLVKERSPDTEVTVYSMDLRTYGKDYERYLTSAKKAGIRFVRALPSAIRRNQAKGTLRVSVVGPEGLPVEEDQDLMILSTGFKPSAKAANVARMFGADHPEDGFLTPPEARPCSTTADKVFACGVLTGPKDIPESVWEGSAAGFLAAKELENDTSTIKASSSPLPTVPSPDPNERVGAIGVALCRCEGFGAKKIDFGALSRATSAINSVGEVKIFDRACSCENRSELVRFMGEKGIERLVLGGCTHPTVVEGVRRELATSGFHPDLVGMVDLLEIGRDETSGEEALVEATRRVRSSVKGAELATFNDASGFSVDQTVLVIGAGVAGMTGALSLAELGHPVKLVDRKDKLGGFAGYDTETRTLVERIEASELVSVHLSTTVEKVTGTPGSWRTTLATPGGAVELIHGGVFLATGSFEEAPPEKWDDPRVVTLNQFERMVAKGELNGQSVAMVQCVGSRSDLEGEKEWCSRTCCTRAVQSGLTLLEKNPKAGLQIYHRDLRTYGEHEHGYRELRSKGVMFVRYDKVKPPTLAGVDNKLAVSAVEESVGDDATFTADMVVVATGVKPDPSNYELAELYGVETDENGFFAEKNPKAATTDLTRKTVVMAGDCHAPKAIDEATAQSMGAAARLSTVLKVGAQKSVSRISTVHEKLCSKCGRCVEGCPMSARALPQDGPAVVVDGFSCAGCGNCTAICPNKAARQPGADPTQVLAQLDEIV